MQHTAALDGIRGIAIILVFMVHFYAPAFSGGNSGVDVFFVLSGFLITKIAYDEFQRSGAISLRDFYLRRAFRILPPVLVLLTVMGVASYTVLDGDGPTLRREILFSGLFAGNLWPLFRGFEPRGALGHTWSLGVEEQFYLVWPLFLAMLPLAMRWPRHFARWVVATVVASILVGRLLVIGVLDYPHWGAIPLLNFDGLALGCLAAILIHTDDSGRLPRLPTWPVILVGIVTLLDWVGARSYLSHDPWFLRPLVLRIGFAYSIIVVMSRPMWVGTRLLSTRALGWVGRLSFSLYLWHLPVIYTLSSDRYPAASRLILIVLRLVLTVAATLLSFYAIEQPAVRLGRRLRRRRAAAGRTQEEPAPVVSPAS
jgi:peptidoglycan/LPS O-acetylase OafA/YrhL